MLKLAADNKPEARACLDQLGTSHYKITIKPGLYDHWLNCLIISVECYDGRILSDSGDVRHEVLSPGLVEMKKQYTDSVKLKTIS